MQLKYKIDIMLKKLKFKPRDFTFNCAIPDNIGILITLPRSLGRLSLVVNTVASLLQYFKGDRIIVGPAAARELIMLFFGKEAEYYTVEEIDEAKFKSQKDIGIIWDLSRPPSPYKDLPLLISSADYRVSSDPETYPYYNIIVSTAHIYDDLTFSEKQLTLLNIPIVKFRPSIRDLAKRTVWDYLVFKGHGQKNLLLFVDVQSDDLKIVLDALAEAITANTTVTAPRPIQYEGSIDLSPMGSEGIVAALALTDIFIGGDSLYLGVAYLMRMPTILINTDIMLPEQPHISVWSKEMGRESLVETIKKFL